MLEKPNVLFDFLTGQSRRGSRSSVAFSVAFAAIALQPTLTAAMLAASLGIIAMVARAS
jgi:hypothetical protein